MKIRSIKVQAFCLGSIVISFLAIAVIATYSLPINNIPDRMKQTGDMLKKLRSFMDGKQLKFPAITAYIIPSDDEHQSEYLASRDERRAMITGFDGSAGTAIVTQSEALLWTDGRYYQQAGDQLDENWTLMKDGLPDTPTMSAWLSKHCKEGDRIGVDSNLMSTRMWNSMTTAFKNTGCVMTAVTPNLVDLVWENQPARPLNKIISLDVKYAGKMVDAKMLEVRSKMLEQNAKVLVLTALDEIAWLYNLRGSDIDFNPVFFSYSIITDTEAYLFIEPSRIDDAVIRHFEQNNIKVTIRKYEEIFETFERLANETTGKVWVAVGSSQTLTALVPQNKRYQEISPIAIMKAIKNDVEAEGIISSHIRDGVALVQYFAWLEDEVAKKSKITEMSGADKLEQFRSKKDLFMGLSFTTISGSGPNGSVIHYHPKNETNREINDQEMYLCDSGAQYLDGTTDVTRTWHFGVPSEFEKECFTRVLKGQMSMGSQIFPRKVKGRVLDTLARKFLWDNGLDYGHGTGHGIGHFLNVHEGPMGIGTREMLDDPGLVENMFMSNEPGYYEDGKFGIRIEDIVQIVPANIKNNFAGRGALTFHTVTMCPIQTKLIDTTMLSEAERQQLNSYHQRVWDTLSPLLEKIDGARDEKTLVWLKKETRAI